MRKNMQELSKSQFILTYGPGSIIESRYGPRLIPSLKKGIYKFEKFAEDNEISNVRMVGTIRNLSENNKSKTIRFFQFPSTNKNHGSYQTYIFPTWRICYNFKKHKENDYLGKPVLYQSSSFNERCPCCNNISDTFVRFIRACPAGHMDDIDWHKEVHFGKKLHFPDFYYWDAKGSSLEDIEIICPECDNSVTMKTIYVRNSKIPDCSGRFPENEPADVNNKEEGQHVFYPSKSKGKKCNNNMTIIQRQSTSLRIPRTVTLLEMEGDDNNVDIILNNPKILEKLRTRIDKIEKYGVDYFIDIIEDYIDKNDEKNIRNFIEDNGINSLRDYLDKYDSADFSLKDVYIEEFNLLKDKNYINKNDLIKEPTITKNNILIKNINYSFDFAKVSKLKTVTAQTGYQRMPSLNADEKELEVVDSNKNFISIGTKYRNEDDILQIWYPVVESIGEGIFITFDENPIDKFNLQKIPKDWVNNPPKINSNLFGDMVKKPAFVWWHSFSHALIRTLSYKSGYNSASIRERVYFNETTNQGGVLLYTTNVGGDGSLGGLISLVDNFKEIIEETFKSIQTCSYDPLCFENKISKDKVNGAACLYCLLLPETSCEHNNMWLDRHLLIGD